MAMRKRFIENNLRTERKKRNISLEDFAETIGVTPGYLALVERSHRQLDVSSWIAISKIFGITVDDLFSQKPDALPFSEEP